MNQSKQFEPFNHLERWRMLVILSIILLVVFPSFSQWKPAGDKIKTIWGENLDPEHVWSEYPRPILERSEWLNLNGLWDFQILPIGSDKPSETGKILVPYPIESSLSGVGKRVGEENELIYTRKFSIPSKWDKKKRIILNFGAVDWKAEVWVNEIKVGQHTGGFVPFSFDITNALNKKNDNVIKVKVWDPTDRGFQPHGKQVEKPGGIWYTPVTGIWQTVWIEPVSHSHFRQLKITPDIDKNMLTVAYQISSQTNDHLVKVKVKNGDEVVSIGESINNQPVEIDMPADVCLWSPENPFLYALEVSLIENERVVDVVNSYAAMRKFSAKRDENGIMRFQLNNKNIFMFGFLDQGWWPDGLYTPPSDEAMKYDIKKTKDFGFNLIRKHIKVEPARWYTHCDQMGIIVWQDMPSGDKSPEWQNRQYFNGVEVIRSAVSEANYRKEWKEIIDFLYSYPSIAVWVPFNEAWGQFKTIEIAEWTKSYDPTRLVNPASGGNHYPTGDILDLHNYPEPQMYLYDAQRINVLGEYGGIGLALENHLWAPDRNWGYVKYNSSKEVTDEYIKYAEMLKKLILRGFSAAIYTQTTDVEVEVNGFITYDRKVIKVEEDRVRAVNNEVINLVK